MESFTDWDLLIYYSINPSSRYNLDDLAAVLGRKRREVALSVSRLTHKAILEKGEDGMLSLTRDPEIVKRLNDFRRASSDDEQRLALLSLLLQKGKGLEWK